MTGVKLHILCASLFRASETVLFPQMHPSETTLRAVNQATQISSVQVVNCKNARGKLIFE